MTLFCDSATVTIPSLPAFADIAAHVASVAFLYLDVVYSSKTSSDSPFDFLVFVLEIQRHSDIYL